MYKPLSIETLEQEVKKFVEAHFSIGDEPEYALTRCKSWYAETWQHIVGTARIVIQQNGDNLNVSLKAPRLVEDIFIRMYAEKYQLAKWNQERRLNARHTVNYQVFIIEDRPGYIEFRLIDPYLPDDSETLNVKGGTPADRPRFVAWAEQKAREKSGRIALVGIR